MLTIVTGLPGACKTLFTLSVLFKQYGDRQIYVHNFDGIDHEYFETIELQDPEKWFEVPAGGVVAIDEAQTFFGLRKAGSVVPEKCARFETHRHDGHDVILITQDATLLDVHVRKLCGKHFHCKRLFGTESSTIFEYNKFEPKPEDQNTIKKAVSSPVWKFDKEIYEHYHSAEVHTVKRKIPFKLLMLPVLAVVAIAVFIIAGRVLYNLANKDVELVDSITSGGAAADGVATGDVVVRNPLQKWVHDETPLVEGLPWTAPKYDEVIEVKSFPKPYCLVHNMSWPDNPDGNCICYSQQITRMNVSEYVCRQIVERGWFDSSREDDTGRRGSAPRDQRPEPPVNVPNRRVRETTSEYHGHVSSGEPRSPVGQAIRIDRLRPPPSNDTPK